MKPLRRFLALLFALVLAGCEDARTQYAQSLSTAPPVAPPPQAPRDDWLTFAHDPLRTGLQPQLTGLDATSVARLRLRWVARLGEPIMASPLVTRRASTWRAGAARCARPGVFAALATATGAVAWRVRFPGGIRSDPVAVRGVVYEGEAGGHVPFCGRGGVRALDERTGRLLWTWLVAPRAHQGGGVWSPLSFDGTHLIFGTGKGCVPNLDAANAVVALDLRGKRVWSHQVAPSNSDDDFGGGTLLMHGQAIAVNRNGSLYDLDAATGDLVWTTPMGTAPRSAGIGSPTSDGATIASSRSI